MPKPAISVAAWRVMLLLLCMMGTFEVLTDPETKKANFFEPMYGYLSGADDPNHNVIRFNTKSYNIYLAESDESAQGTLLKQ